MSFCGLKFKLKNWEGTRLALVTLVNRIDFSRNPSHINNLPSQPQTQCQSTDWFVCFSGELLLWILHFVSYLNYTSTLSLYRSNWLMWIGAFLSICLFDVLIFSQSKWFIHFHISCTTTFIHAHGWCSFMRKLFKNKF